MFNLFCRTVKIHLWTKHVNENDTFRKPAVYCQAGKPALSIGRRLFLFGGVRHRWMIVEAIPQQWSPCWLGNGALCEFIKEIRWIYWSVLRAIPQWLRLQERLAVPRSGMTAGLSLPLATDCYWLSIQEHSVRHTIGFRHHAVYVTIYVLCIV